MSGFTASAHAVAVPTVTVPSPIVLTQNTTLSWTPDPNATTLNLSLEAFSGSQGEAFEGIISCSSPDSAGSFVIDQSLLANFHAGDTGRGTITREVVQSIGVSGGQVSFSTQAVNTFTPTFQ